MFRQFWSLPQPELTNDLGAPALEPQGGGSSGCDPSRDMRQSLPQHTRSSPTPGSSPLMPSRPLADGAEEADGARGAHAPGFAARPEPPSMIVASSGQPPPRTGRDHE